MSRRQGLLWWFLDALLACVLAALSTIVLHLFGVDGTIGWAMWSWALVFWLRAQVAGEQIADDLSRARKLLRDQQVQLAALRAEAAVQRIVRRTR